jgi:hypothetical protein
MSLPIKHPSIRTWCLPLISALATLVVAAAVDPDENWVRLRALSGDRRARLVENLKKFDLLYSRQKQDSLRALDRRIHELAPNERARYLAVLRRYHNWLNQLPETKQDELNDQPPAERMAAVAKLVMDYPIPKPMTPRFVQMVDVGEYSPFELASFFMTWQAMTPQRRAQVERLQAVPKRHEVMRKVADAKNIPHEIKPADFDDLEATTQFEDFAKANKRPVLLLNELKKNQAALRTEILRRLAINHYFLEHPPIAVTPVRLADFLAAFPVWLQSAFDHHPPDEAQRRLTIVYRLVFPAPLEMGMKPPPQPSTPAPDTQAAKEEPDGSTRPAGKPAKRSDPF